MTKKNNRLERIKTSQKVTPYMLLIIHGQDCYYDEADRIMKNATLEEAKEKARKIWEEGNYTTLIIKNEKNKELFRYVPETYKYRTRPK